MAVSPFCIAFAVVWAVYRDVSFAWIGQDILVRKWCQKEACSQLYENFEDHNFTA